MVPGSFFMHAMNDHTTSASIVPAEELALRTEIEATFLHLPEARTCFAEREMRLRQLAAGHAMQDFLLFMAELAHAQQEQLNGFAGAALPDAEAVTQAALLGRPPLPAEHWTRDSAWQQIVRALARSLRAHAPEPAHEMLQQLEEAEGDWLELQADKLLHGIAYDLDMGAAPVIGAALQVYWTWMVDVLAKRPQTDEQRVAPFGRIDDAKVCPCCGSKPVSSVVKAGAERGGQRYLQCSLCGSQWNMVRIKCTHCESTKGLQYHELELADVEHDESRARKAVVQAETCDECGHYSKLIHADRDVMADAVADDLASLTLDLLVSESGKQRHGVNMMLLFGAAEPEAPGEA